MRSPTTRWPLPCETALLERSEAGLHQQPSPAPKSAELQIPPDAVISWHSSPHRLRNLCPRSSRLLRGSLGTQCRWLALVRIQAAIFANAPEMNRNKEDSGQRKNHAVQHVETQQRIGVHCIASEQQEMDLVAHHRHRRG